MVELDRGGLREVVSREKLVLALPAPVLRKNPPERGSPDGRTPALGEPGSDPGGEAAHIRGRRNKRIQRKGRRTPASTYSRRLSRPRKAPSCLACARRANLQQKTRGNRPCTCCGSVRPLLQAEGYARPTVSSFAMDVTELPREGTRRDGTGAAEADEGR